MSAISSEPSLRIQEDSLIATVGFTFETVLTFKAALSYRTHSYNLTNLSNGDFASNVSNLPHDLVAGAARIVAWSPVLSNCVDV